MIYLLLVVVLVVAAVWLWLRAVVGRIREQPEFHHPQLLADIPLGDAQTVEREDGTRLQVFVAGQGPTVVLLHGFGMTASCWNVVGEGLLEKGYQVITLDHRGHGRSTAGTDVLTAHDMADDIRAVLQEMEIRDAVMVGHSMGAFLSLRFALMHPTVLKMRLKGMVLVGGFAGTLGKGALQTRIQIPLMQWGVVKWIMANRTLGWVTLRTMFGRVPSPGEAEAIRLVFGAQNHRLLKGIMMDMVQEDHREKIAEISARVEVLVGERDRATPPSQSVILANGIADASLLRIPGCGHMLNWEDPDAILEAIERLHSPA